jgi:hypothetical protein
LLKNPSEEVLENYNKIKEELDLTLQEWEYLGSQLRINFKIFKSIHLNGFFINLFLILIFDKEIQK